MYTPVKPREIGCLNRMTSTRARIIDATAQTISDQGVRSTTVAHLLTAADVSRRTFYKHFRSAEDALASVYEEVTSELLTTVTAAMDAADPIQKVLGALDAYVDFVRAHDPLVAMLHAEAARADSLLSPARRRTLDALVHEVHTAVLQTLGAAVDPWVYRGLLMAVEGLVIEAGQPFDQAARDRVRAVAGPMFIAVLAAAPHLPKEPVDG